MLTLSEEKRWRQMFAFGINLATVDLDDDATRFTMMISVLTMTARAMTARYDIRPLANT